MARPKVKVGGRSIAWYANRLRDIIAREGYRSLWFRVLALIGYRRVAYLECEIESNSSGSDLDDNAATIRQLQLSDGKGYVAFRYGAIEADFAQRLNRARRCYGAFVDGRLASVSWVATGQGTLWLLKGDFSLRPDQFYLYDSFTLPEYRGKRLQAALFCAIAGEHMAHGYRNAVTFVVPENVANLRSRGRMGFTQTGRVKRLGLGPLVRFYSSGKAPALSRHR